MDAILHVGMDVRRSRHRATWHPGERYMELVLQFGWGMMAHSRSLLGDWGGGEVVLSPRDLSEGQLDRLARDVHQLGGEALLDPQFYLPHSDHERLQSHSYWPGAFEPDHRLQPKEWATLLTALAGTNERLGCRRLVLPGILADSVDHMDVWLEQHETMLNESQRAGILDARPCLLTVALGADVATNTDSCEAILEWLEPWRVDAAYLVVEHPGGRYLSDDPSWLSNTLDLVGGLILQGKKVVVGYSNQQMLLTACAGATAIASGTWMNVRSFPPEKFRHNYDEEMRQRKKWYYAPQTLSEYGIPYLDMAARQGLLDVMRPSPSQENRFSARLLAAPQPSTGTFSEADAFLHFLSCLREQALSLTRGSFDETLAAARELLTTAEHSVVVLAEREISAQTREFGPDVVQACRSALVSLEGGLGPRLRRSWGSLVN